MASMRLASGPAQRCPPPGPGQKRFSPATHGIAGDTFLKDHLDCAYSQSNGVSVESFFS